MADTKSRPASDSPWLIAAESAERARCGTRLIYREAKAGRLRHAIVGGRRELRFKAEWIDEWLERTAEPVEVTPLRRVGRLAFAQKYSEDRS